MQHLQFVRLPLVWASVLLAAGMTAQAQISPGPLARSHADLDSATGCFSCHGGEKGSTGIDVHCVECHSEIDWGLKHDSGLHGRESLTKCSGCHPDHAGLEFELIEWDEGSAEAFDHGRTGWALNGAHRKAECSECHRKSFQTGDVARLMQRKDPGTSWLGLQPSCATCHADVHRGTLGDTCATCHSDTNWKPAPGFDHDKTKYTLDGKHVDVTCVKCHGQRKPDRAVFAPLKHQQCSSCHEDVHRNAFGPECSSCHSTAGFKVLKLGKFDHSKTRFPLIGKHGSVECASCHDPSKGSYKREDDFSTCSGCHSDAHAGTARWQGAAADCGACHDERGFRPSTLTVEDHERAAYKLEGAHREVACEKCHIKDSKQADRWGSAAVRLQPAYETCTACHEDAHAGQLDRRANGGACVDCHTVTGWKPSTFGPREHAALEFTLAGAHGRAECAACHGPRRTDLAALPDRARLGSAGLALTLVEDRCSDCHFDPHEDRFEATCDRCHGMEAFRPSTVGGETHASFRYPLAGAHRTVPCVACHEDLARAARRIHLLRADDGAPISFAAPLEPCSACHSSPHQGQFGQSESDCASCHNNAGFVPAPGFDHDATFPLVGNHRDVACMDCHVRAIAADGTEYAVYRPLGRQCENCHKPGTVRRTGGAQR